MSTPPVGAAGNQTTNTNEAFQTALAARCAQIAKINENVEKFTRALALHQTTTPQADNTLLETVISVVGPDMKEMEKILESIVQENNQLPNGTLAHAQVTHLNK